MNELARLDGFSSAAGPQGKGAVRLTRRQKAAIVVRVLMSEGADVPLTDLPDDVQADLIRQMGGLRVIDTQTLRSVAQEFLEDVENVGLSFSGGLAGAISLMDGAISPAAAASLRRSAGLTETVDPWLRISGLEVERLKTMLMAESVEVAAVALSRLKVAKAAEVLGLMPGPHARRIAYAISQTSNVSPSVVNTIGDALAAQLDDQPERAFEGEPVDRVGAILNVSPAATRDDVLAGLDETDSPFAERVRKTIFTFAHIPLRVDPRDVPKITRAADPAALLNALAFAQSRYPDAVEFMLSNLSQRMATQFREDMEGLPPISEKDGESALTQVTSAIRELEAAGEMSLAVEDA